MEKYLYREETELIIGLAYEVHNHLGPGFLEIVYKDALEYEFKVNRIDYHREKQIPVIYKATKLPHYFTVDFLIFNEIILEIKAQTALSNIDFAQTLNYLKVSDLKVGLLMNFGEERLKLKRIVK